MGELLTLKFDYIFYTGSSNVGKIVSVAAAKTLTPVTMELGGQGPTIIGDSADLDIAASTLAWGKFMNAGQICIAPNHVFVSKKNKDALVQKLKQNFDKFLGEAAQQAEFSRIVNERNFDRVSKLVDNTKGTIVYGGKNDKSARFIHPTVISDVKLEDSMLSEEIFGPVLPIITANVEEAISHINSKEHPLALYIFSNDQQEIDHVLKSTRSGGVSVNDVILHASVPDAPFGGIGNSGSGNFHGVYGFNTFTHLRTISRPTKLMVWLGGFRFPPYTDSKMAKVRMADKKPPFRKNETLEDQRKSLVSTIPFGKILRLGASSYVDGACRWAVLLATIYYATGETPVSYLSHFTHSNQVQLNAGREL